MAYGLRKINRDGMHHGFQWPLTVGSVVKCPDWDPSPKCGNGFHLLPNAQGFYWYLTGYYWVVVEYDENELVIIDRDKGKVPECKIVYLSKSPDGLLDYFKDITFNSESAYNWAREIGDREYMKQFITESESAYYWARSVGDREYMKPLVTEPRWISMWNLTFEWAIYIGDLEHMKQFIPNAQYEHLKSLRDE